MTFTAMYSVRLDEGLEVFNDLVSGERSPQPGAGGFEASLYHGESGVFLTPRSAPDDFILQLEKRGPEKEYLRFDHQEIACLEAARAAFGFAGLSAIIRRTSRQVTGKTIVDTFKGITFRATLRDGTEFDHDRFSFGQKRLLTFLWYAAPNVDGPIIADELANGLHHAWIDTCMRTIGDRQAFLATQNPLIFDFLEFASAEQARVSLVRCSPGETESGAAQWRWNNLTTDEAERLFIAYEARFQHVSELLRVEGLW